MITSLSVSLTRPPHALLVVPIVQRALEEDLGRGGDLTSDLVIPVEVSANARILARKGGTCAGLIAARAAFALTDPTLAFEETVADGATFEGETLLATVSGSARSILLAERVALNFLGHLSGIATATRKLVDAVEGTPARIVCTRKTTPGLRLVEKYAVRCGGGRNHRQGLDDAVLIKDNHLTICGGVRAAVERARSGLGHMVKIELEVDRIEQLEEALGLGVDTILLDNMNLRDMRRAVVLAEGRATLEASGNVTLAGVRSIAETGVDYISSGAITHSAPALDVALDF